MWEPIQPAYINYRVAYITCQLESEESFLAFGIAKGFSNLYVFLAYQVVSVSEPALTGKDHA